MNKIDPWDGIKSSAWLEMARRAQNVHEDDRKAFCEGAEEAIEFMIEGFRGAMGIHFSGGTK